MKKINKQSGFTLIEMIMVTIIVVILATIAVFQFVGYRKGINVETTAEEISLNVRKAQTLALAVRSTGGLLPVYQNGYGVHFELGGLPGPQDASDTSYIIFTDYENTPGLKNWDKAYLKNSNPGAPCGNPSQTVDECVEKTEITSGDRIIDLSLCTVSGSTPSCTSLTPGQYLDISFFRPNLDAYFCSNSPMLGGCVGIMPLAGYAQITVKAPNGAQKIVKVWSTGQISIE